MPLEHTDPRLEAIAIRETVARYCRLDFAGYRLNPSDWPKMQTVVAWPTNPEFSFFLPVSRFDIDTELVSQHNKKYKITVHYHLIGRFEIAQGFSSESANQLEDVEFVVSEVNGDWRVVDVQPNYPHPSRAATLQWVTGKLTEITDPATKTIYQNSLDRLQPPPQKTPAANP